MARVYGIQEWDMAGLSLEGLRALREDMKELNKQRG